MANKEFPLSIVLRTVDKATAGINAVNKRLDAMTRPTREFGKALKDLGEKSGLNAVGKGFAGVGGAVKDLAGNMLAVAGVAGGAVVALVSLVGSFDDLGDKAEALGTSVDFLASMRYAAERSGASVEALDAGLQGFTASLGQARAGTGKMAGFLKIVSPALLTQVKAAKSNEAAFLLLADAMAKIQDPAKRAAFAQKTLGDASLAPLLARGSKGINELRGRYKELAGSQEDAASAAGGVDDAMKDLKASTDGIKASLVAGLSPALKVIIDQVTEWLSGHRDDVRQWAEDIGHKLPGAVDAVVDAVKSAVRFVSGFVDSIGGWKVAAGALAAVMAGPLVSSVAGLGIAMLTMPFGPTIAGFAAVAAAVVSLVVEVNKLIDALDTSHEAMLEDVATLSSDQLEANPFFKQVHQAAEELYQAEDARRAEDAKRKNGLVFSANTPAFRGLSNLAPPFSMQNQQPVPVGGLQRMADLAAAVAPASAVAPQGTRPSEARIKIDIGNAPRGTRVAADPQNTANVDLSVGYQMLGAGS